MVGAGKRHDSSSGAQTPGGRTKHPRQPDALEPANGSSSIPSKRRRVTRACDQCRQGREKCDGTNPCHTCKEAGRSCSYKGEPKRRGVQPGYIRALEVILAWTLANVEGSEIQLLELLAREPVTDELGLTTKDPTTSDQLSHAWLHSSVHDELELLLAGKPSSKCANAKQKSSRASSLNALPGVQGGRFPMGQSVQGDIDMLSIPSPLPQEMINTNLEKRADHGSLSRDLLYLNTGQPMPSYPDNVHGQPSHMQTQPIPLVLSQTYVLNARQQDDFASIDDRVTRPQEIVHTPLQGLGEGSLSGEIAHQGDYVDLDFFNHSTPNFSYGSTADLETFLDELASTEFADASAQQPQFMQNLGFGPDMTHNEFISETGEWIVP